jgi:hypothetical protein
MTEETLSDYKQKLDENLATVMPRSWDGHARLAIRQSDDVPASIREHAVEKAVTLAHTKDKTPEKAANDLIRAIQKKRD